MGHKRLLLVFGLPQTQPDRIVRWISAGTLDMGEQSTTSRIESSASHGSRSAMLAGKQAIDQRDQGDKQKKQMAASAERERVAAEREGQFREQLLAAVGGNNPGSKIEGQGAQSPVTAGGPGYGSGSASSLENQIGSSDSTSSDAGGGMSLGNQGSGGSDTQTKG